MTTLLNHLPLILQSITVLLGLVSAVTMAINAFVAAIPAAWRAAFVKRYPRSTHWAEMARAGGTHLTGFLVAASQLAKSFSPPASVPGERITQPEVKR